MLAEPDVALSDYALVVETFLFTFWLYRGKPQCCKPVKTWFLALFVSIGLAALVGGTVHGFFTDERSSLSRMSWSLTMILLGATALSEYGIAARLMLSPQSGDFLVRAATLLFVLYVAVVLFWNATFRIAVIDYLSGLAFLAIAFLRLYSRNRMRAALVGLAGLILTVVASVVQQVRLSINPRYFNHNALYHLLEGIALFFIFTAARSLTTIPIMPEAT